MNADNKLRWIFGYFLVFIFALLCRGVARIHLDPIQAGLAGTLLGYFGNTFMKWTESMFQPKKDGGKEGDS